jgi:cyclic pyranopterin phosphate synthase
MGEAEPNGDRERGGFSHLGPGGEARMVDVGGKQPSRRRAVAAGEVRMKPSTLAEIRGGAAAKGDVLAVARVAGIQAAKRTSELVPLCHPLPLEQVVVEFDAASHPDRLLVRAEVLVTAKTGAEMEALTAVAVAALTVYDMCKAVDRDIVIERVCLLEKSGGKSGTYSRPVSPD